MAACIPGGGSSEHPLAGSDVAQRPFVLVPYCGRSLCQPGGVRFTEAGQAQIASLIGRAFASSLGQCLHVELSSEDVQSFAEDGSSCGADTYGELKPEGFLDMLWRVGARPGDRFYDLGSGTGKLAALAWLAGLRSTGIELSSARWEVSCHAVEELQRMSTGQIPCGGRSCSSGLPTRSKGGLDYIRGSMLELDFSDADVLFVSTVMFTQAMVAKVARIARWMRPGSRIVSFHNLARLDKIELFEEFEQIGEVVEPTSWKDATCFQVVQVVHNPEPSQERPPHLKRVDEFDLASRCCFAC
mmetsp:Transcript_7466/g.23722  ORF Transcript_7466/g.23722 Transcript_7466/m.23722 type:complete len:300 (-) Transcript_7466:363-1262(-)|eukprot:CAMPEP_0204556928 /NCGR_PEP_ID=MMETSP0661-20131031/29961_1 /ASSEMBLY_ACC=CAM_ASM_000606 /TAXON_ID=109239 /ORGANISM="Alexandrium margalefi, Strain AMGDE01CS-322" /LENGTH=299 /DNA_ID=CAMNT_0051564041 /DNA_START=82 /DNA_END=981 /DNA_ORIENTATION=-